MPIECWIGEEDEERDFLYSKCKESEEIRVKYV